MSPMYPPGPGITRAPRGPTRKDVLNGTPRFARRGSSSEDEGHIRTTVQGNNTATLESAAEFLRNMDKEKAAGPHRANIVASWRNA